MSSSDNTTQDWRDETSSDRRGWRGAIRRMAVSLTSGVFWQVVGHRLLDGAIETRNAEVFAGVGFYARPRVGHRADALVVFPGGAANPIIIATRDEDARKAVADLAKDESAMFNSQTIIIIKADGTVEIRASGGTAQALATKADVVDVADAVSDLMAMYNTHTHSVSGAVAAVTGMVVSSVTCPAPAGTTVLRAQ